MLVVLAALGGCQGPQPTDTPDIKAAGDKMRAIHEQCDERRRSGEFENLTEVERCVGPRVIVAYEEAHYPYMDLIRFAEAARLAGAEKVDSGEITEAEYDRQRLLLRDRLADEINRRNKEAASHESPRTYGPDIDPATRDQLVNGLGAFSALER
ncbi:MAG TPA: hypothetical protein VF502_05415 [Stellaceae bacterium]